MPIRKFANSHDSHKCAKASSYRVVHHTRPDKSDQYWWSLQELAVKGVNLLSIVNILPHTDRLDILSSAYPPVHSLRYNNYQKPRADR